jgi:hypothetical protein
MKDSKQPEGDLWETTFTLSEKKTSYTRQVFGILDLVGQIGGFASAVFAIAGFFASSYLGANHNIEMVRQVFKVKVVNQLSPALDLTNR